MKVFIYTLIFLLVSCGSEDKFSIDITKMRFRRQQGIDAGQVMSGHRLFEGEIKKKKAPKKKKPIRQKSKSLVKENESKGFFSSLFNPGQEKVDKVMKECEEMIDEDTKIFSSQQNVIELLSSKNKSMERYIDSLQNALLSSKRTANRFRSESRKLNRQNENLGNLIDLLAREIQ